jgi:Tol biopolymer transport system component
MVPALGGPERRLQPSYPGIDWWLTSLSWSPDGKLIAFPAADSPQESPGLLLSVDSLEKRRLTSTLEQYLGDGYPVFSPDGQTLAFIRQGSEWAMDIYVIPVSGGEPVSPSTIGEFWAWRGVRMVGKSFSRRIAEAAQACGGFRPLEHT